MRRENVCLRLFEKVAFECFSSSVTFCFWPKIWAAIAWHIWMFWVNFQLFQTNPVQYIYICLKIPNVSHICETFGIFRKACSSQYSVFVKVNENWDDNSVLGFWQLAPLLVIELKSHQQKKCSCFTKIQILHSAIFNFSEISNCAFFSLFSPPSTKIVFLSFFSLQVIIFDVNTVIPNKMRNKCHISTMAF